MDALKILLLGKGARYNQVSYLNLIYQPLLLKFAIAPLVDAVKEKFTMLDTIGLCELVWKVQNLPGFFRILGRKNFDESNLR